MSIHLVVYSNNEPFHTTKNLILQSIHRCTTKPVIIHNYTLEIIKEKEWFKHIANIPFIHRGGRRDGYYNSWKAFIVKEVYDKMNDGDIVYYVDSSKHFRTGFTENIDILCDIASKQLCIAGSIADNVRNNSFGCCTDIRIWNKILPNRDNTKYVRTPHVLNSWFVFKKCESNTPFIHDWAYFSSYTDTECKDPLVTYHHTGDQSIFNILVIKYRLPVFYSKNIDHDTNKDKNVVLRVLNRATNHAQYFTYLE
jgi:hypothetical protein